MQVLTIHLAHKLIALLRGAKQFTATPHLENQVATVEPLVNSLHHTLSRLHPPGDIDPHLKHVLSVGSSHLTCLLT
jgi:hypothetical protein